ncbi:hypothetical protein C8A03DRAFT_41293 [Achaetomium macrosporum]|uniref:Uncharacterized protein n=1 Tax=Achaetomium macrosporum TaxID=79813 RepID=A0AAN7CFP1_9PEZI|nr:hypothetical protein C8A03DRAFT_41293 [Achaetomium macrosporum]
MEECLFRQRSAQLAGVVEETSYLEILNYTDASNNSCRQDVLPPNELLSFVRREGAFAPPRLSKDVKCVNGLRLMKKAEHLETFTANTVSLPLQLYEDILREMRLPLLVAEATATVGPFFWFRYLEEVDDSYLQIIFRKADTMLSYSFKRRHPVRFAKGTLTPTTGMALCLSNLRACAAHTEEEQREARQWLNSIERALVFTEGTPNLRQINQHITECYAQVLWKSAPVWRKIINRLKAAAKCFWDHLGDDKKTDDMRRFHIMILERLDFHKTRLGGIEGYASATTRLKLQRGAVQFLSAEIAQQDAKLNLKIAGEQRRLAHASTRDGRAMKGLSLLGAIFLPGTFLASIFSMSFFNFEPSELTDVRRCADDQTISSLLWIYFALTTPLTGLVVLGWLWWERARQRQLAREQAELEESIQNMEKDID